jgi:hypothetical protein
VGWLRSNGGKVSWLAFFALACHFVVTFSHVHIENIGVASSVLTKLTDTVDRSPADTSPATPKKRLRFTPDFCAICGSINLVHALVLPVSPGVFLPGSFVLKPRWFRVAIEPDPYGSFSFRARGPPNA